MCGIDSYVTGSTNSNNFPTANALYETFSGNADAFIAKIWLPSPSAIPTLDEWSLILLGLLMVALIGWQQQRRLASRH